MCPASVGPVATRSGHCKPIEGTSSKPLASTVTRPGARRSLLAAAPAQPPYKPPLPKWAEPGHLPRPALKGGGNCRPTRSATCCSPCLRRRAGASTSHRSRTAPPRSASRSRSLPSPRPCSSMAGCRDAGRSGFVLSMLGRFGDDATARRLAPLLQEWPGQSGGRHRAAQGLGVFVEIGSDAALAQLNGIAQKVPVQGPASGSGGPALGHRGTSLPDRRPARRPARPRLRLGRRRPLTSTTGRAASPSASTNSSNRPSPMRTASPASHCPNPA